MAIEAGSPRSPGSSGSTIRGTRFHPCVVLLLDDEGRHIGQHLTTLLACLPAPVRAWVEQLPVAGTDDADAPGRKDGPDGADLERRIGAALARVTNVHLRDAVRQAGYHVGDAVPLVLLVGHTSAPTLLTAARASHQATTRAFTGALRVALLSDTRPSDPAAAHALDDAARAQPWDALLGWVGAPGQDPEPPLGLCLLYQDVDERNWHWNAQAPAPDAPSADVLAAPAHPESEPEDVRYAAAEAAFALIASGIVDTPHLREQLQLNMPTVPGSGGEAERRFGTLATARLAFPRAQAETATAAVAGAGLLEAWLRDAEAHERALSGQPAPAGGSGRRLIRTIRDATEDSAEARYRRGGMASPPLSARGVSRLYGSSATQADPARIFAAFRTGEIAREQLATGTTLPEALATLDARARARFERWRPAATAVWGEFSARAAGAVTAQVEDDLAEGPAGLALARAYLRDLSQSVIALRERQEDAERFRAAGLQRFLRSVAAELDDLALQQPPAPAAATPATASATKPALPAITGPATASLPASASAPAPPSVAAEEAGEADGASDDADATQMPVGLRLLADALAAQLGRDAALLSSGWTVLAALVMLLPFLAYAAVGLAALLPFHLPALRIGAGQIALAPTLTALALSLLVALPPALLFRGRVARVRRIRRLLVALHVRWWADCCGRFEDALRRRGIQALTVSIEERLTAVSEFEQRLRTAAATLRARAEAAEGELRHGPASRRDIFVLAGRRFPALALGHLHELVHTRRQRDPLHPSHATAEALGAAFREQMRLDQASLLSRSADDLAAQAQAFGGEVCHPYLVGELVNVTPSLHLGPAHQEGERVALGALLERATPLFRPLATDSIRRHRALAGPDDLALLDGTAGASGLIHVPTPSAEWLIVGQIVSQGRPRWWRRGITSRTASSPANPSAERARRPRDTAPVQPVQPVHGERPGASSPTH